MCIYTHISIHMYTCTYTHTHTYLAVSFTQALSELNGWLLLHDIVMDRDIAHDMDPLAEATQKVCQNLSRTPDGTRDTGKWGGGRSFLWATCGDWDLKTIFPKQCAKSGVALPSSMREWCNLKVGIYACMHAYIHTQIHIR